MQSLLHSVCLSDLRAAASAASWCIPASHHAADALIPTQHVLIPNTGLFLGGYYALSHVPELGVTHILSVVNGEMSRNMCAELLGANTRPIVRHHVDLIDAESSNLLVRACLPACLLQGVGKLAKATGVL